MNNLEMISLGSNCSIKISIKKFHPNQETFPFDWLITNNIDKIIEVIDTKNYDFFKNFQYYTINMNNSNNYINETEKLLIDNIDLELIKKIIIDNNTTMSFSNDIFFLEFKKIITATINRLNLSIDIDKISETLYKILVTVMTRENTILVHDHHINISWEDIKKKYDRRFRRFFSLWDCNKKLIFVRYESLGGDANKLYECLKRHFKNFNLLILYHDDKMNSEIQNFDKINDHMYIYKSNLIFNNEPYHKDILSAFIEKYC